MVRDKDRLNNGVWKKYLIQLVLDIGGEKYFEQAEDNFNFIISEG